MRKITSIRSFEKYWPGYKRLIDQHLGDNPTAQDVFDLGSELSYIFKNAGVADAIDGIPLDRIVLETDGPYLAPTPHRGTRNEPAYVPLVAQRLAEVRGLTVDEVARVTTATARRLFKLPEG